MVYRGGPEKMSASAFEQALAQTSGVTIHCNATPVRFIGDSHVPAVEFDVEGASMVLNADMAFTAIGQAMDKVEGPDTDRGRIVVDEQFRTSLQKVWAGGDCVLGGDDLTVTAVQHGKVAAISIDAFLRGGSNG